MPRGDSVVECAKVADSCKKVVAIGINCTAPRYIHDLIISLRQVIINNDGISFFFSFFFYSVFVPCG